MPGCRLSLSPGQFGDPGQVPALLGGLEPGTVIADKGYDSQAHLYRLMLQTGSVDGENPELAAAIGTGRQIGVMYYMLNDQTALADTSGWSDGLLGGFHELGAEISVKAMDLIKERIAQLEKGIVTLNSAADEEWFNRTAGTTPYALNNSPLIRLFMKQDV